MTKLSISDAFATVTVDLWGHEFDRMPITRSVREKLGPASSAVIEARDEENADALVDAIGAVLDLRLKASDGKRTAASKLIHDRWHADDLDLEQLLNFTEEIGEAGRPI